MRTAIRKHWIDFVAIIGLILIAGAVAVFILGKQRLTLPAWVPLVGKDFFVLKADMSTAQAVTPGQGQTVNIAGVEVGEISNVELKDGKAVITMKMQPKYSRVYSDATVLLRPKTGLKDMVAELEPGTPRRGPAARGRHDPGEPDAAGRQPRRDPRVGGRRHARLPDDPAQRRRPRGCAATAARWRARSGASSRPRATAARCSARSRRASTTSSASIHNLSLLMGELGARDDQVAEFVENSNAVFATLAGQDANLRSSLSKLPTALQATQSGLGKAHALADELGPTLQALRPGARALGPTLRSVRPFVKRDHAGHPRRDPPVRARLAADGHAAEADAQGPRDGDARPHADVQGRQPPARHARLQPARPDGGLPVLGRVGEPHRQPDLHDAGRARPDPPRPVHRQLPGHPRAPAGLQGQPAARHADRPAPRCRRRSARSRPRPRSEAGSQCRRPPPPSVASPSWPASRCPASACCCSCGSRSAATSR